MAVPCSCGLVHRGPRHRQIHVARKLIGFWPHQLDAIQHLVDTWGLSFTETVRRLIQIGLDHQPGDLIGDRWSQRP